AGKVQRTKEGKRYFEEQVEPYLSPTVEYYPNVAGAQKARLISRAAAGIFPLQWAEPFGLAMVECMVAGTPVLALRSGSTPELIEEGVTGFLAEDVDDLVEGANRLEEIDRVRCATVARERPVVDAHQPRAVKGVAADHPLARFLRPHLVEDEVAVRVGDEVAVVDLDWLHPVWVVADDEVGPVVNREVADLFRVVRGDA